MKASQVGKGILATLGSMFATASMSLLEIEDYISAGILALISLGLFVGFIYLLEEQSK